LPLSTCAPNFTYQIEQDDALDAMAWLQVWCMTFQPQKKFSKYENSRITIL